MAVEVNRTLIMHSLELFSFPHPLWLYNVNTHTNDTKCIDVNLKFCREEQTLVAEEKSFQLLLLKLHA